MRYLGIVLVLMTLTACNTASGPQIIGHRGAMGYETENTVASVQKALELGVDMIEIDVFRIKSGEIVVFHDERVERLTNGGGRIEEYLMFDLKKLLLDGGHQIPMLQEVLKAIDHRVPLNIELKGAGTAERVHYITNYYTEREGWQPEQFLISSFNWDELRDYRALDTNARIAVLTEEDPLEALEVARELGAEAINPAAASVTAENVQAMHEAGFRVNVWTVNEPEQYQKLKAMGVDAVFTDYPDRLR